MTNSHWYKKWHQNPVANLVHYLVFAAFVLINLIALYQLQLFANNIYFY